MRARGPSSALATMAVCGAMLAPAACGTLKIADTDDASTGEGGPSPSPEEPTDGGGSKDAAADALDAKAPAVVTLPVVNAAIIAGSLSIVADDAGEVALAWLDTPSAKRHLHIARIAGGEDPPRIAVLSDTPLESMAVSIGQAVAAFSPAKGCFGVLWGQSGVLNVAAVAADATPGPTSIFTTVTAGPIPRLSQVRAVPDGAGGALVAWSDVARFGSDATGVFHSGALGFAGCAPGAVTIDADPISTGALGYKPPPAGAPELAVARVTTGLHAAFEQTESAAILGVAHRARAGSAWGAATSIDDGGTVNAGGSIGIASSGSGFAVAYYRRSSDTLADLVVATLDGAGARVSETILEHDVLTGMAAATYLEVTRLSIVSRGTRGPVIAAAIARDAMTSELRAYRADPAAPGGYRSELLDTGVFGPRGAVDGHPLVDLAADAAGRVHVAWRSGATKALTYARLPP